MVTNMRGGPRLTGPVTTLTALVANATAIWQNSAAPTQVGVKTFRLKKIRGRNVGGGNQWLHVGTGAGATYADVIPPLYLLNNIDFEFGEEELGDVEVTQDLTAYPDADTVTVQAEVEEIG